MEAQLDNIADAIFGIGIATHNSVRVCLLTEAEHRMTLREQAMNKLTAEEREVLRIDELPRKVEYPSMGNPG